MCGVIREITDQSISFRQLFACSMFVAVLPQSAHHREHSYHRFTTVSKDGTAPLGQHSIKY
jgi:hypothetical protein